MIRTEKLKSALLTVFGVAVTGAAVSIFYIPNKIVNGGVSGISTILFYAVGLRPSISFALINLVLLIAGFRVLGSKFVIKTIVCSGLLSLFVDLFSHFPPLTHDVFLATVFGAALYGVKRCFDGRNGYNRQTDSVPLSAASHRQNSACG